MRFESRELCGKKYKIPHVDECRGNLRAQS